MIKMELGEKMLVWFQAVYKKPQAIIRVNGLDSETIFLTKGVQQGCPLSPILFNIGLEALATPIRQDSAIKDLVCNGKEFKLAQHADDTVFFLIDPDI